VRSARTLGRYVQDGGKYCLLAGAGKLNSFSWRGQIWAIPLGSIFLLMIMAVAKLKSRVRDAELTSEVVQRISQLMRNPRPGESLQLSTSQIWHFRRPSFGTVSNWRYHSRNFHSTPKIPNDLPSDVLSGTFIQLWPASSDWNIRSSKIRWVLRSANF